LLESLSEKLNISNQLVAALTNHIYGFMRVLKDSQLMHQTHELQLAHANPLNKFGKKCFSQSDEDGLTLEIIRRMGIGSGVYAEFGVGDGLENNTLILAALKWRGFWVGGQDLVFRHEGLSNFSYIKNWITLDNILELIAASLNKIRSTEIDVVSLDLDGNDFYLVQKILQNGISPKLFIVEYNAKFPPPVKFCIEYNGSHVWAGDDYFGASLQSFVELFENFGYRLVCCNTHTGANAFFVRNEYSYLFADVPTNINQIYVGPRYFLYHGFGHKPSVQVIERIFLQ
jgi:hypothetical protein